MWFLKNTVDFIRHSIPFICKSVLCRGCCFRLHKSLLSIPQSIYLFKNVEPDIEILQYGVPQGIVDGSYILLINVYGIVNTQQTPIIILYADHENMIFSENNLEILARTSSMRQDNLPLLIESNYLNMNNENVNSECFHKSKIWRETQQIGFFEAPWLREWLREYFYELYLKVHLMFLFIEENKKEICLAAGHIFRLIDVAYTER